MLSAGSVLAAPASRLVLSRKSIVAPVLVARLIAFAVVVEAVMLPVKPNEPPVLLLTFTAVPAVVFLVMVLLKRIE